MKTLLLHSDSINNRGTSTAVHEYATWLEGNGYSVIWAYPKNSESNLKDSIEYFGKSHTLVSYSNFQSFAQSVSRDIDWAYFLKKGNKDGLLIPSVQNNVHVVFNYYEPHGSKYLYISEWLAAYAMRQRNLLLPKFLRHKVPCPTPKDMYVPHCVDIPAGTGSLRGQWGIPESARVCVRYGGEDTFDIPWVRLAVVEVLNRNPDYYFVGINTRRFTNHKRAFFFPPILDPQEKSNALRSADVFLHGRLQGESFGLAIVEALQAGLTTLAWHGGRDLNHRRLLESEHLYRSPVELIKMLEQVKVTKKPIGLSKIAEAFRPNQVMPQFEKLFGLKP
jgi:hypothetical protein